MRTEPASTVWSGTESLMVYPEVAGGTMAKRNWLAFGIGNPSRGDDALGPLFTERLEAWANGTGRIEAAELPVALTILTDFQCQVEHALDLRGIEVAFFVDASLSAAAPFELTPLRPLLDLTYSTHALSPACVLAVAEQLGQTLPETWLLAIPGESFELGAPLGAKAERHLDAAFDHILACLRRGEVNPQPSPAPGVDGTAPPQSGKDSE